MKKIVYCLHVYPQFGQPLFDLKVEPIQVWIGVVEPLVVEYAIDEARRLVIIGAPPSGTCLTPVSIRDR